ncbi:tetratricopeptide repeat protein [Mucilaginibacter sp. Bleaf8]|uniref:tetratricopeptide repeat protein n=1 Tax=Mucilaginibacter sp. Bleaf8 TaxID=2834430 RepID=UPI001BCC4D58|nr:tetratricopeptide repeat protein [Mucilaginibacter sp. Bleaf8]MBS7563697.1 tetratricopeptide repeat protein [Mucilaginibacter sp. Bleaf8]
MRLTDAAQTVSYADRALRLARKLNYGKGVAIAYRIKGLGEHYLGNDQKAIINYLQARSYYHNQLHNTLGEINVINNIGALYLDIDYDKSLQYFNEAMNLYQSEKLSNKALLATIYLNLGNVYQRKLNFSKSLVNYDACNKLVKETGDKVMLTTVLQNMGVVYTAVGNYEKAKSLLFEANKQAKALDLNQYVARTNLSLAEIFIAQSQFTDAEKWLKEGKAYASISKNEKLLDDYQTSFYELELKRKNFEQALHYLQGIYRKDSIQYRASSAAALNIYQVKFRQDELQQENEVIQAKQRYNRNITIAVVCLAVLLCVVVILLVGNVKRKAETNKRLTELNNEISVQKDNLDRINHHLEEIIDERTKDLQIKNKKLSEYSSYLSHQIRGPIATLKGLMNLEKEGLVNQSECIAMMVKCVGEIDDKIMDMSDMLHNPERAGL